MKIILTVVLNKAVAFNFSCCLKAIVLLCVSNKKLSINLNKKNT